MNTQNKEEPIIHNAVKLVEDAQYMQGTKTLLVEADDQDKSLGDLTKFTRAAHRNARLKLVGLVDPTEETLDDLAILHAENSVFRTLDTDPENIKERLENGALLAVWSTTSLANIARYRKIEKQRKSREAIPEEVYKRNNIKQSSAGGRGSHTSGLATASIDWNGSLDGGPLKVGGLVNQSPK